MHFHYKQSIYILHFYIFTFFSSLFLGLWAAELDPRITWQWIPCRWRALRSWRPNILHEPRAAIRLCYCHHFHLLLPARRSEFFTDGCVRFPAKFSSSDAPTTTYKEGRCDTEGPHEMPGYKAPSFPHDRYSVWLDAHLRWRGMLCCKMNEEKQRKNRRQIYKVLT